MTRIGICKVNSEGRICHKNAYARELCDRTVGMVCKLHQNYLPEHRSGAGDFILPEVVYKTTEYVAAVAIKIDNGHQIYFRSIKDEPAFSGLLPDNAVIHLTTAESNILEKIFLKKTNQEIADQLFVSLATIKTHIAHLYQKVPKLKDWRKNYKVNP